MTTLDRLTLAQRAEVVGAEVAGRFADDVDATSRFPQEALDALRADGQLSALVPVRLGGAGASLAEVAEATFTLARHCASTGMVYAMHHLQVACLVRHAGTDHLEAFLGELAERQLLLASATTEIGTGGDITTSICAVERDGGRFRLEKKAPVLSYGAHADAVVATARRNPDAAPNDQVMVLCTPPGLGLEPMGVWDALGMRGTCSSGFVLRAEGDEQAVLADPFDVISARTNQPVAHILWAHVWLGIAAEATHRARTYVQTEARRQPGVTPAGAGRLAELDVVYRQLADLVRGAARTWDEIAGDAEALSSVGYALSHNALKVTASTAVVDVVGRALGICGMAGYRLDTPYTMGRLLRDAHSAALMINNDRLLDTNARWLLVDKRAL